MSLKQIEKFHGHIGVWACIGFRAGKYAKKVLKPKSYKDLTADVYLQDEIPYTCALDGVQLSSCCTIGKKNLKTHDNDDYYTTFTFLNKKTDKHVKLKVTKYIFDEIELRQKMNTGKEDQEDDAKWILKVPITKLFEINK